MKEVGDFLVNHGYEFLAVNSKPKKDPQFVCLKDKKIHFIVVRGFLYPNNPKKFDLELIRNLNNHGAKYSAKTYFAGVGFANANDYNLPLKKDDRYVVNFDGLQVLH